MKFSTTSAKRYSDSSVKYPLLRDEVLVCTKWSSLKLVSLRSSRFRFLLAKREKREKREASGKRARAWGEKEQKKKCNLC